MEISCEGITYAVLPPDGIRPYVLEVCRKEWTPRDFHQYGAYLDQATWKLENVFLTQILPDRSLLARKEFQEDLQPRIKKQKELYQAKTAIPPLILRGNDYLIFDGYARYHFLKRLNASKCLAYVGESIAKPKHIV